MPDNDISVWSLRDIEGHWGQTPLRNDYKMLQKCERMFAVIFDKEIER